MGGRVSVEERQAGVKGFDTLNVPYEELTPVPFPMRWSALANEMHKAAIYATVNEYARQHGDNPPLTQVEINAIAQHFARGRAMAEWATPTALVVAGSFYYKTYNTYGFPFWEPKAGKFNPNKFGPITNSYLAPKAWHLLRCSAWYAMSKFMCMLIIASYSASTVSANILTDPRLKECNQILQENRRQGVHRTRRQQAQQAQQALSPAQQEYVKERWNLGENQTENAQPFSEQQPQENADRFASNTNTSPWTSKQPVQPGVAPQPSYEVETGIFDDASPVAMSEQRQEKMAAEGSPQANAQNGSWERLRAQARGESQAATQAKPSAWGQRLQEEMSAQAARDGTNTSYTYESTKEKPFTKERAQMEFDEMLERERNGKS
ncbi:hypothetical protein BD289DRAFT_100564 [Coniella lustricola]|uniref:Uncharacterized protein n=1 Tax=Coniella lustricola TaxID=2025994 RepID=A0A2T3AGN9_9PEZI|nr:hypothetical protein BD289DRAFT_100564 [Coniella lustricola]